MFKGLFFFVKEGWKYDKLYVLWNLFYQLINAPGPVIMSFVSKLIVDELMFWQRIEYLLFYTACLTGYTLLSASLSVYFQKDGFSRRCTVAAEFDSDLHKRLYECDFEKLEDPNFLSLQEKAKKFLYCNWHGFGYLLDCALNLFGHILTLIGIAAIISSLNILIILSFVFFTTIGAIIDSKTEKKIKKLGDAVIKDQRGWMYYAGLFESSDYGKEFRLYRSGSWLLSREREFFTRSNSNIKKQNDHYIKSGIITAVFTWIQQIIIYLYLIQHVLTSQLSIGSFTMYISAATAFAISFRQVVHSIVEIRSYDMYFDDLEKYLSVPKTLRSGKKNAYVTSRHIIEFRNVSFKYPGSTEYTLKNINITLHPSEKLLVVGENGAGKTTFIKLLLRLYDPTEGEILLDGININEIDYDSYQALFTTVFQDYKLFAFSLKENIAMSETADDSRIEKILMKIGLGRKASSLNAGLDTMIHKIFDENGFEPSGGEGQKIALARALYKDSPIIILDEPTAALDPRAEYDLYQQFSDMVKNKSAVYISHRLGSSRFCDVIAVFEKGKIIEYGSHDMLVNKNGKYAELFRMQANLYYS